MDGTRDQFFARHPGPGLSDEITSLHCARDGVLWVGTSAGLYNFAGNRFETVIPLDYISRIEESVEGHLLVISSNGFIELNGTRVVPHPGLAEQLGVDLGAGRPPSGIQLFHVFQDRGGALWFCTARGLARRVNGSIERFQAYGGKGQSFQRVYEDPKGNLWVSSLDGVFRVAGTKLEFLAAKMLIRGISADREGNLWIGTNGDGLLRFRDRPIRVFSKADGLPNNIPMTVVSKRDGTLWVGNNCGGLSVFDGQRFKTYDEKDGMSNSCVWALAEGNSGELWVGTWLGGLYRFADGHFVQFTTRQGLADNVVRAITIAHDGSLWIATLNGLSHMANGQFHNYTTTDGLSSNRVVSVYQDRHGTIWVGTSRGINRMTGERFVPVSSPHQIFDPRYISLGEDSSGDLIALSAPKGIDRIEGNQLVEVNHDLDPLSMVASPSGELWFSATHGILRFSAAAFRQNQADPENLADYTWFGQTDGMTSTQCSTGAPNMALAPDGKLWVATVQGLAMLDLPHLSFETAKPVVFVEDVTVGRTKQPADRELVLPPGTHHVELRFDSITPSSPEKTRFQYRMDDVDPVWLDADKSLTAVYTNIPVGTHAFRVRASNSAGVWDRSGVSFPVTQKPAWYQTTWFRALCVLTLLASLWGAYKLRVRQLRLEEKKLRDVIETMPTFAWTARSDGFVDFANRHWQEYTGLSTERTVGSGWQEVVHPEDLQRHAHKWALSLASGETFENEVRYLRADGQYRWFLSRAVPLRDGRGKILKWYGTSTDIEDRKTAEQLQADLAHVNRVSMLGELAASISHELKQPITAAMLNARTCITWLKREKPDLEEARETAKNILNAGKRASEIIDSLRLLYKKAPAQRESVDINEIMSEMVVMLRGEANRYAVSERTDFAIDLPKISVDRVQLQQVLMNLMLNAIEAMKDAGGVLTLKSQLEDGRVLISISDTGVGLPAEKGDQIFNAFFTTKPQGSGMGLAISRSIVESHGGRLWATTNSDSRSNIPFQLAHNYRSGIHQLI